MTGLFNALLKGNHDDEKDDSFVERLIPFMPSAVGSVVQEVVDRVEKVEDLSEQFVVDIKDAIMTSTKSK